MSAVALTDHGNMFGAIQLYKACKEAGRQGDPRLRGQRRAGRRAGHGDDASTTSLLLAATEEGYKNLVALVSRGLRRARSERRAGVPCVTLERSRARRRASSALTGCMGGVVAQRILEQGESAGRDDARRAAGAASSRASLYVELQDHGLPEQPILNGILRRAARRRSTCRSSPPTTSTTARRDDARGAALPVVHRRPAASYAEARSAHHGSLRDVPEDAPTRWRTLFRDMPEALERHARDRREVLGLKLKLGKPMLPDFQVPEGFDSRRVLPARRARGARAALRRVRRARARRSIETAYRERLEIELDVI